MAGNVNAIALDFSILAVENPFDFKTKLFLILSLESAENTAKFTS